MEYGFSMNQELRQRQTLSAYQYQSLRILHLGNAQVGDRSMMVIYQKKDAVCWG